mmetsp:Transcript_43658/g.103012  ORF Transcript_43658/g.103012 Transcript_43658/m.103012 type:complete len:116 (+) Transcript_43658:1327-1674(+)
MAARIFTQLLREMLAFEIEATSEAEATAYKELPAVASHCLACILSNSSISLAQDGLLTGPTTMLAQVVVYLHGHQALTIEPRLLLERASTMDQADRASSAVQVKSQVIFGTRRYH